MNRKKAATTIASSDFPLPVVPIARIASSDA
jgi:hypothetical protein